MTIWPGDQVYSAFGHSAFRVVDDGQGLDVAFNYGTFDFDSPLFALRFARGQLDYFLSVGHFPRALRYYDEVEGRPVVEQSLALTPDQARALYAFLVENARPENRTYRYDFLFDNCSTRLRDALEDALGADVAFAPVPAPEASFRRLLDPYLADARFLDLGIDLLLGLPTDRDPTPREATFLPLVLAESFDHATLRGPDGERPLVARTDTLVWQPGYDAMDAALPWPTVLFWLALLGAAGWTLHALRTGRAPGRWLDPLLFAALGLAGLLMLVMWLGTDHHVTALNLNLLWAWPTHLVFALALRRAAPPAWLRPYALATAATALLVAAGWPLWPQALHPAVLPLLLLVALRAGLHAHRLRPAAVPQAQG